MTTDDYYLVEAKARIEQLESEKEVIESALAYHQEMTQLILNGGSINSIIVQTGIRKGYTTEVEDRFHNLLYSYTAPNCTDPYHQGRVAGYYSKQTEVNQFFEPYFKEIKATNHLLIVDAKPELGLKRSRLIAPIMVEKEIVGYLTHLSKSESEGFSPRVLKATQNAALVCAISMMKEKGQAEIEHRLKADFLEELMRGGSQLNLEMMQQRGPYFGFNPAIPYLFVMIELDKAKPEVGKLIDEDVQFALDKEELLVLVDQAVKKVSKQSLVVSKSNTILLLASLKKNETETVHINKVVTVIQKAVASFSMRLGLLYSIAIGGVCQKLEDYPQASKQARHCLELLKILGRRKNIVSYKDLGIYTILLERQNKDLLFEFVRTQLGNLLDYDCKHGTCFVETLGVYFTHNQSIKDTANAINIHVNGMRYRMQRIEEVGNIKLRNQEDCFNLQLALKILEIDKIFASV